MDAVEQLKEDLRNGRFDPERLLAVVISLQRQLLAAQQRIAELERNSGPSPPTNKVDQPFSLRAEEQRQKAQGKNGQKRPKRKPLQLTRKGRLRTADKLTLAVRTEKRFPANVPEADCTPSHTRPVWRLENGRAVVVAYEIYRDLPRSTAGPRTSTARSPASWDAANSASRSSWRSPTSSTSRGCRSTRSAGC